MIFYGKKIKNKLEDKAKEDKIKAHDDVSVSLTEDEISQLKEALPVLAEFLPQMVALLSGEAEIEILDDSTEEEEVEDIEDTDKVPVEELESTEGEEEKAEDNASTFNAEEVLKDPNKRAAIEAALKKTTESNVVKANDAADESEEIKAKDAEPKKKVLIKKTLNKAQDEAITEKNVNADIVGRSPVVRKKITSIEANREIRQFDFHSRNKK